MHVLIQTMGSRGDVQPYIALGLGLMAAGHRVTLSAPTRYEGWIREYDFGFEPLTDDLIALLDSQAGLIEDMGRPISAIRTGLRMVRETKPIQRALFWDGWAAAEKADPDLIVYHPKMFGAVQYAEKLGIPVVLGTPIAQFVPTSAFPSIGMPSGPAFVNRASYRLVLAITKRMLAPYVREWRAAEGMPPLPRGTGPLHTRSGDPIPVLHAISPSVLPQPPDWPDTASMTGYWFLDVPDWTPPPELAAFLDEGEPPVYVGFGSMTGHQPERLAALIVEALQRAGVRGILASGWGGLAPSDLPESIHLIDQAPHDALFPRMAAVVHHGGAGTTAAGLRAGRPTIICPFFGDQPFWGRRVEALGVGPAPIPKRTLTADGLARAIRETLDNDSLRQRAEDLGEAIRAEDGVAVAVAALEAIHSAA